MTDAAPPMPLKCPRCSRLFGNAKALTVHICPAAPPTTCAHENFTAFVEVAQLIDSGRLAVEVRIECAACGRGVVFPGIPIGMKLDGGACVNFDGTILRAVAVMHGEKLAPLPDGAVAGFKAGPPNTESLR